MTPEATARSLRALAGHDDAMRLIGDKTLFRIGDRWFHNSDHETDAAPDRCLPHPVTGATLIAPHSLSPMELVDDACDFERVALKLETRK